MTTEKGENDPCSPLFLGLPARHNIETIFKNNIAKSESTKKKGVYAGKSEGLFPVFRPKKLEEKKSNICRPNGHKNKDGLRRRLCVCAMIMPFISIKNPET